MLDRLSAAVVRDLVGRGFGPQYEMIADVWFDEAVAVVAAADRVGQMAVFDHGLEFAPVKLGQLTSENGGDLVGLADSTISLEQALTQTVQGGPAAEDVQRTTDAGSWPHAALSR